MQNKLLAIILIFLTQTLLKACAYEPIYNNTMVTYSPATKTFSTKTMSPSKIALTKKISESNDGHSEYYAKNGSVVFKSGGDFEFIENGKLISVHNDEFKYFEVVYDYGYGYKEIELKPDKLQKLFPDAEIVKISQISDGKLELYKKYFRKKSFLLYNDTDKTFPNCKFSAKRFKKSDIKGYFKINYPEVIKVTTSGDNSNSFSIIIKNIMPDVF